MADLFGGDAPVVYPSHGPEPILVRWKRLSHYRKADPCCIDRCRDCCNFRIKEYAHRYFKCILVGCGNSPATDIRANHICDFFNKHINAGTIPTEQKD